MAKAKKAGDSVAALVKKPLAVRLQQGYKRDEPVKQLARP